MTVTSYIATQKTDHGVPNATSCRALEVPGSTFYKWLDRPPTPAQARQVRLDEAVKASFDDSGREGGTSGTYGSPRVFEDLIEDGWVVSVNTVAQSMMRQGLQGRTPKRKRRSLTRPDKAAAPIADLIQRDFNASAINEKWCGDLTEIPTDEGKLYLATVEDLAPLRLSGFAIGEHHDAGLARAASSTNRSSPTEPPDRTRQHERTEASPQSRCSPRRADSTTPPTSENAYHQSATLHDPRGNPQPLRLS